jgi:hypothetical protein
VTEEEEREGHSFAGWLKDRKNRRKIPHRFECCGYVPVRNSGAKDGLWKIHGSRQVIYARAALSVAKRHAAANELVRSMGGTTGEAPAEDLMSMGGGRK